MRLGRTKATDKPCTAASPISALDPVLSVYRGVYSFFRDGHNLFGLVFVNCETIRARPYAKPINCQLQFKRGVVMLATTSLEQAPFGSSLLSLKPQERDHSSLNIRCCLVFFQTEWLLLRTCFRSISWSLGATHDRSTGSVLSSTGFSF